MTELIWRDTVGEARLDLQGWICWRCLGDLWSRVRLGRVCTTLDGWKFRDASYVCAHCEAEAEYGLLLCRPLDGRWAWCTWLDAEALDCGVSALSLKRSLRRVNVDRRVRRDW
jgi:hypothetical protein